MNEATKLALSTALIELSDLDTAIVRQHMELAAQQRHLDAVTALVRRQIEQVATTRLRIENALAAQAYAEDPTNGQASMIAGGTLSDLALAAKEEAAK